MRVLFLYPYLPSPQCHHGSAQLVSQLLSDLQPHAEVTLIAGFRPNEAPLLESVQAKVHRFFPVLRPFAADLSLPSRVLEAGKTALGLMRTPWPVPILKLRRRGFLQAIESALKAEPFDVAHIELSAMAPYVLHLPTDLPTVLVDHESGGTGKRYANLLLNVYPRFRRVVVLSEEDRTALLEQNSELKVDVRLPGFQVAGSVRRNPEPNSVLFFGSADHAPNQDAVQWICEEILPRLVRLHPDVRFRFAGTGTHRALKRSLAASPHAKILGFVDSIEDEIDRAAVVVSPLRLGRGVRIKNLEAMARGAPLVTTVLGAQGLLPNSNESFIATDSPDSISEAIVRLLMDRESAEAMGSRGRDWVKQRFDPSVQLHKTLSLWREIKS